MDSEDPFFLNHNICGKAKQILSQFNIPLLNYQSLLVSYEELSIIHQISFTPYKTTYKAFYQQKIVFAEVYNLAYAPSSFSSKEDQIVGIESSSARDNEGETTEQKNEREEDVRVQLMIQLSIMKALSHENFVDLIGVGYFQYHIDLPPQILVISDYNEHNLDDISSLEIQEGYKSSWKERMSWLKEIVSGLLLLEKYQITVKELTARNIFFNIHFKVKMKVSYDIEDMIKPATTPFEEEKNQPLINIASQFITPRNVIFSFGSILFQIITGKSFQQYFSNPSSSSSLPNVEAVTVIDGCPEALRLLMIECINHYQRSSSGDSQSTVVPVFSIQEIWKQLDQIWNLTFPPENPSNQLLRRNSLSATQSKLSFKVKNNPFEDSEDEERERYYQDGIPTHRPSVATRRISVPTQDSMENMFAQYQPPSQTSPSQHRPSSLKTNPFNNSNEHSPFPSPKGQSLLTSVSELNKLIPPSFDRKEDIIQYLIYFLNRTFQETELQLNEHLELVENLYIVEAPASAHLNDPQMKAKKQKEVLGFRQSIESFFLQLETIKKQLVFLYLYCDLEETDDLNQTGLKQLPDGSNFQSLEEKDSLRRTSHNQLLQLLNEILNDAPTSTADSFTGNGPATTTEEIYHFYRHNSQTLPSAEMKRRLSILRQESTIDAAVTRRPSHSTEEQFDEKRLSFRQQSHPISAPIANEDATGMTRNSSLIRRRSIEIDSAEVPGSQPTSDVKKRSSFLINDQEKSPMKEEAVHKVVLSDIRKSVSVKKDSQPLEEEYAAPSESRKSVNVSVPLAGSQALRTEQLSPLKNPATIEQKVNPPLSLHQRLFNQQDEPFVADTVPTESLTFINPPIPPPASMIQPTPETLASSTSNTAPSGPAVRRTSSYEALAGFNRRKSALPASNQSTIYPPPPTASATNAAPKIPGVIVGRKNSLVLMDNKTAADLHQRKMSLLRPSSSESHDYSTQQTITPDFASPAGKLFSDNFGYEEDQPSTNIPFTSSALKASTPSTIQGSQPPTPSELYGNGIAPLRFIHGRQIPANINHQAESSQSPPPFPAGRHPLSTVKTPIEKANEFINRVKQLDSMYLTRSQDPIEENPTNNRNVSYLHENTFTGSLSRLESTQTAVNNGGNQPNSKKNLTNALTSFLKVIEKCQDTSIKAKQLVHQMDHGINQIGTTSSIASSQRSVSPNSLPRHMSPTISYKGKVSPSASQRNNMRINTTAQSTFAPSSVSPSPSTGGIRRSMSPASSLNGSFHYPTSEKKGRWKNFFDNDDPTPLNNSFQSLYNVNNSANPTSAASVVSSNSRYSSPTRLGSRNRSNSPKIRYSIHKEPLSAHKSPVTFSFASRKKR